MIKNAREYKAHIKEVTNQCLGKHAFADILSSSTTSHAISCVDHNCESVGGGAFPGSLWGLELVKGDGYNFLQYFLEELSNNQVTDLTVYTHAYCGMLFTELNLISQADQDKYAIDNNPRISELALLQHGIVVTWAKPRRSGTAQPWMT